MAEAKRKYQFPDVGDTIESNGATVVAIKDEPYYDHLATVLCLFNGKYVTWTYNASTGGAAHGNYFGHSDPTYSDLEDALEDFKDRAGV